MAPHSPQTGKTGQFMPGRGQRSFVFENKALLPAWGVLLFLLIVASMTAVAALLLRRFSNPFAPSHGLLTPRDCLANIALGIAVTFATGVLALFERRRFVDYGFRADHLLRNLLGGALAGIALLSALVLLLHQRDLLVFRGQVLFGAATQWKLALEWLAFYALAAYVQESLLHGYLQYTLTRGFAWLARGYGSPTAVQAGFWIAAFLLSVLFALLHRFTTGETPLALLNATLFTLLLAFSLWRTGSLWWALGYRLAWDWAQSFLWGLPSGGIRARDHLFYTETTGSVLQSGGATGPQGSAFTLGAMLAGFGILMLLHKRRIYPEL